jgi:hypothetical protein
MSIRKDIRNFYIDETFIPIWNEFKEICNREGESASEKLREFISRYVMVHGEGNPQMLIDRFCGEIKKGECFFCKQVKDQLWKVQYVSGLVVPTCKPCLEANKAKRSFSTVKKVMGIVT